MYQKFIFKDLPSRFGALEKRSDPYKAELFLNVEFSNCKKES
jgi:hypothetical protein